MSHSQNSENDNIIEQSQDTDGNVDKIRQILFGGQMRDYDQRFDALEKRITQNVEHLTKKLEGQFELLSTRTQQEMDKLSAQIDSERKERLSDNKGAGKDLQDLKSSAEDRFTQLNEQLGSETKELRNALLDQSDELTTLIRSTCEQISSDLEKEANDLSDKKLARADMATLLTEVAKQLNEG